MNLQVQRAIDYHVGRPACLLLSWLLRARERLIPRRRAEEPTSALFIELAEMGSTIIASPAIQRFQQRYPDAETSFVIFEKNANALHVLGLFESDHIFTIRDDSLWVMFVDVTRFARFCRARRVDTVIDLELFTRIASLLSMMAGASSRVGFHNYHAEGLKRGEHLTHRVTYNPHRHMSQNYFALVEALDRDAGEIPLPKLEIPLPGEPVKRGVQREVYQYIEQQLAECVGASSTGRVVVVNHDAGMLLAIRSWPQSRFAELISRLLAWDSKLVVVLIGLPEALQGATRIAQDVANPRCVNFVGRTRDVQDVVQLLFQCDLLITNDSGVAHFASLTDIRSITLFGPETPDLYAPLGENGVQLYKPLACSPCLTVPNYRRSSCTNNLCLQEISVEEVFATACHELDNVDRITISAE